MIKEGIFREYDIRGIVGKEITAETAVVLGRAFGAFVKKRNPLATRVSIGRDVRLGSESLARGLAEGITATGLDVIDLGTCPTPLQYFSLFHLDLDGGIMVTGSHNPPEYNGFKISIGKETIYGQDIQQLKRIIQNQEWCLSEQSGSIEQYDIIKDYREYMLNEFSYLGGPAFRKLRVVIDAGNGTAGLVLPEILDQLGCEVVPIYCEPDGTFPHHHPDPTVVENIQDLIATTHTQHADIGIGYDGDADRIGVVDRNGTIIWGDQLMIVLSRELLKRTPGAKIIGDVKCSQVLFDDIRKHKGVPIMWKTGHSLVKSKMREEGALIAGEFSGHIFIGDRYFGFDDALYTTLRLVEIMKTSGKDIQSLLSDVPRMYYTPEIRIDCPEERKKEVVGNIVARCIEYRKNNKGPYAIREVNIIDGIRVVFDKGWGLVRSSNTQPVVVMRVEAEDKEHLERYRAFLEREFRDLLEA
ncbi:MAG: phosphomannomutase/phosphoglucomutase [Nitrospirota bacterium]